MKTKFNAKDGIATDRVNMVTNRAEVEVATVTREAALERFILECKNELEDLQNFLKFNSLSPELKAYFVGQQRALESIVARLRPWL